MHKDDTISIHEDPEIQAENICCTTVIQKQYSEINI